jgi:hypothetical protein
MVTSNLDTKSNPPKPPWWHLSTRALLFGWIVVVHLALQLSSMYIEIQCVSPSSPHDKPPDNVCGLIGDAIAWLLFPAHLLPRIQVPFLANAMASIIQVGTFFCIAGWLKKRVFGRRDLQSRESRSSG